MVVILFLLLISQLIHKLFFVKMPKNKKIRRTPEIAEGPAPYCSRCDRQFIAEDRVDARVRMHMRSCCHPDGICRDPSGNHFMVGYTFGCFGHRRVRRINENNAPSTRVINTDIKETPKSRKRKKGEEDEDDEPEFDPEDFLEYVIDYLSQFKDQKKDDDDDNDDISGNRTVNCLRPLGTSSSASITQTTH